MPAAAIGYAQLSAPQPIRLHAPGRFLPIIVVPDFMGTRLNDPPSLPTDDKKGTLIWNPTGFPFSLPFIGGATPGPFACDYERLSQVTAELLPDENYKYDDKAQNAQVSHIKHYFGAVTPTYDPLLTALAKDGASDYLAAHAQYGKYNVKPRVYFAGYDWRRDNAASALRLASVVEEALADTGERKCILIGHGNGGNVARYYCKMLGGETKVFALFLMGTPLLGTPEAYTQLKHGLNTIYPKDFLPSGDSESSDDDTVPTGGVDPMAVATGAVGAVSAVMGGMESVFIGKIYIALCLGAGKSLSRQDIIYFLRQMPSVYQMMPSANFCRAQKNWLFFDPLATGIPGQGFLLKLPTLTDLASLAVGGIEKALSGAAANAANDVRNQVAALSTDTMPADATQTMTTNAALLSANCADLVAMIAGQQSSNAEGRTEAIIASALDRLSHTFIDCRSSHALYDDIFTGLTDIPELRAISTAGLQIFYNFDDSLTNNAKLEKPESAKEILGSVMGMVVNLFKSKESLAKSAVDDALQAAEDAKTKPKQYMHPKTIAVYSDTVPNLGAASILMSTKIINRYDSNVVKSMLLPNPLTFTMPDLLMGDGFVPKGSAKPDDQYLSSTFDPLSGSVPMVMHNDLCSSMLAIMKVKDAIAGMQKDWWNA